MYQLHVLEMIIGQSQCAYIVRKAKYLQVREKKNGRKMNALVVSLQRRLTSDQ